MKQNVALASIALLLLASIPAFTQPPKKKPPVKTPPKPPVVGTLGTAQAKGGDGLFGTTYTIANSGGSVYNVTLVSAEYSVFRHNINDSATLIPKADEKLLILHLRAQNPNPADEYFSGTFLTFSTVAKDDKTRDHNDYLRLTSAKEPLASTLKAGQKFPEEILACCIVPANGPVPKLILNMGRKGTKEEVTRYFLGKTPNTVKPLSAPYADPTDSTGATALSEIPAKTGVTYAAGYYDFQVDSAAYAPGPMGDVEAGDGKRLLIVTVTLTNKSWSKNYFNTSLAATLFTDDDEKTEEYVALKGKRDERFEGRQVEPAETFTQRLIFTVPKNAKGKKLKLAEALDNTGNKSRAFVYDLASVQ